MAGSEDIRATRCPEMTERPSGSGQLFVMRRIDRIGDGGPHRPRPPRPRQIKKVWRERSQIEVAVDVTYFSNKRIYI
jgi:hypothetical protein